MKKGGLSTADVAAQYKYKTTVIDVKVDTGSNVGFFVSNIMFSFPISGFLFLVLFVSNPFLDSHLLCPTRKRKRNAGICYSLAEFLMF